MNYTKNKPTKTNRLTPDVREFVADWHNFTNKYPTRKVANMLGVTRQAAYSAAETKKKKEKKEDDK